MNFIKNLINKIINHVGYRIISNNSNIIKELYFELDSSVAPFIKPNTMLNDLRLKNIVDIVQYICRNNVEGAVVECGVWKGGSVALMAHTMLQEKKVKSLHLFDAFDEICEPDAAVDGDRAVQEVGGLQNATGKLQSVKGIYNNDVIGGAGNDELVKDLILNKIKFPENQLFIHKGWFQDTLPLATNIDKIAFLRLDGDWYASTKVCLDYLYDKLVVGGVIAIDDYGAYEGCKKAVDEFCENKNIFPLKLQVDSECLYWVKAKP